MKKRVPTALAFMGLIFAALGIPFLVVFFPWRLPDELRLRASARTTEGTVTVRESTSMRENNVRVSKYAFTFKTDDGTSRTALCYETGDSLQVGSRAVVEYLASEPSTARIRGCRLSPFGWGAGFVMIFPLVGVGMIFVVLRARRRVAWLLANGRFCLGHVTAVDATNVSVNHQTRYAVSVSYQEGTVERVGRYYALGEEAELAQQKMREATGVGVLHDPEHPERILLVDELVRD